MRREAVRAEIGFEFRAARVQHHVATDDDRVAGEPRRFRLDDFDQVRNLRQRTSSVVVERGRIWLLGDLEELRRESPSGTTTQALEAAERFLVAWPASAPLPSLSLDPDGEISFDWAGPSGKVLTVSLREDGRLSFAARLAARRTRYGTDWFVDSVPRELIGLARLVCGA